MHNSVPQDDGSPEVNQVMSDDKRVDVKDVVSAERLVNNLRINGVKEEIKGVSGNTSQFQIDAQRSNGQSVRWERFLPVKSLKVLLVENDDSTRHVVSALLRNCSYEVTAVSNGYQAWKILEDLNNQIDLVLTEVVMPGLSGIGLLSKIMNHKTCKNLPVIMMSSHDSMGIVFKCLSKGAVDFLVKPLRKNELKNLWQHVWRKCHSSSGSGSESGVRTEKSVKSRSMEDSENEIASSDEDDKSLGLSLHDGSDNGSGTQSSWTKRTAEVESPQAGSPWEKLSDPPDSTCAQVIHSRPEAFASSWVPVPAKEEHKGLDDPVENDTLGKYSQIGPSGKPDAGQEVPQTMILVGATFGAKESPVPAELQNNGPKFDKLSSGLGSLKLKVEQGADLIGVAGGKCDLQRGVGSELPCGLSEISENKDKSVAQNKELPSLELTLKRTIDSASEIRSANQDQNTLRHSELSAFTKYQGGGSTINPAQTGIVGSCSPLDNSSDAAKTNSNRNRQFNSSGTPLNQGSSNSSNNNDMGSTTYRSYTKPPAKVIDKPSAKTTAQCLVDGASIILPDEGGGLKSSSQIIICDKNNKVSPVHTVVIQADSQGKEVQVQHHHHHYHHHHHHHHVKPQLNPDEEESSQQDVVMETVQCGSSSGERNPDAAANVVGNTIVNRSGSGSNHGSNTPNGSVDPVNAEGVNLINVKCEAGDVSGSGSGTGIDQNRSAVREAALNKFRQKRKERCFDKKVRYQSRKKLAEQRPRVRGQFVKQNQESKSSDDTDS